MLVAAFLSGCVAFATGRPGTAPLATAAHGLFGLGVVVLLPWKAMIVRRARSLRPVSVVLAVILACSLLAGFVQLLFGYRYFWVVTPIQIHVGGAVVGIALLAWHVSRHRRQRLRRADMSRRALVRVVGAVMLVAVSYAGLVRAARMTGGLTRPRTGTGSRPVAGGAIPATIWLADRVPELDRDAHRVDVAGEPLGASDLSTGAEDVRARLDCTSGWYADATWTGRRLSDLIPSSVLASAVSLRVTSVTGYVRLFPPSEADRLWLVVRRNGEPLTAPTGAPVRLVAPGRRGFWWVKWVAAVEVSRTPSWLQPPFPA
jgi:DMSO/TMAO reductase YedYZ molybdopterin-dependent catalytic subunit